MYYIYTIENDTSCYVGCTSHPLSRFYCHASRSEKSRSKVVEDGRFFLRHHTEDAQEAVEIERALIISRDAVNTIKVASVIKHTIRSNLGLSVKWKPRNSYIVPYRITMMGGKRPSVYYNKKWHKFDNISQAEDFIVTLPVKKHKV